MLRNVYQSGILTVLNSASSHPLQLWAVAQSVLVEGTRVAVELDSDIGENVVTLESTDLATTFVTCPRTASETLGVKLPYMFLLVKCLDRLFSFEVEALDDRGIVRRLRASNYEVSAKIEDGISVVPLQLDDGCWNYLTLDIALLLQGAFGARYQETSRVTFHASAKLRVVGFADLVVPEDQLPKELRLYCSVSNDDNNDSKLAG
ncbi:Cilia- and flagella-associated protein 20 [Coemansia aciculifera]|nr:Cilia- and flagella-associated protein 20 [Coemansia aciculifera]